jgi:hypothetical protein
MVFPPRIYLFISRSGDRLILRADLGIDEGIVSAGPGSFNSTQIWPSNSRVARKALPVRAVRPSPRLATIVTRFPAVRSGLRENMFDAWLIRRVLRPETEAAKGGFWEISYKLPHPAIDRNPLLVLWNRKVG